MDFKGSFLTEEELLAIDFDSQPDMAPGDTANCPSCATELTAVEMTDPTEPAVPFAGEFVVHCTACDGTYLVGSGGKSLQ